MSAIAVDEIAEPYIRRRALRHMEKGVSSFLPLGLVTLTFPPIRGLHSAPPKWSEVILKGTKVDGVYNKDPAKYADAVRYETLEHREILEQGLRVMDSTASFPCVWTITSHW